jgi:CheY-like chemotaxis protein
MNFGINEEIDPILFGKQKWFEGNINMNNNATLLIVDDSKVSRMMIRNRVLALQPGWTVYEAGNADEAFVELAAHAPDFISMDVNMPGINGFEAVAKIREIGCNALIVMLTANIQQSSRDRAAELNVHFVKKPATADAIQDMLNYFNGAV